MGSYSVLLISLLFCFSSCLAEVERRCGHARISKMVNSVPLQIVQETPDESAAALRSYPASSSTGWDPVRFLVSAQDVLDPQKVCTQKGQMRSSFDNTFAVCRRQDILTPAKKHLLLNELIPRALKLHSERLLVQRVQGRIRVPIFGMGVCAQFNVPTNHHTIGVVAADMIIYVASGPTGDITAAWASTCSIATNRRPIIGVMNYGPHVIEASEESIRVAAHEIAHAIGFDVLLMGTLAMLRFEPHIRGQGRLVVASAATLQAAQKHYNCTSIRGMELENQGGQGTALSHWERRNAKDELMGGFGGTAAFYTSITMAVFDDMKFFKANWGMEEDMAWGNNSGCAFLNEKCLVNGTTKFPTMFCNKKGPSRCTTDLRGLGTCRIVEYEKPLPPEFQYFASSRVGGDYIKLTDFCPYIDPIAASRCHDGNVQKMPGSVVGPDSMCLTGESLGVTGNTRGEVGDVCAEVTCKGGIVRVRYAGSEEWHLCSEGEKIKVGGMFSRGFIVCPRYVDACRSVASLVRQRRMIYVSSDAENTFAYTHWSAALFIMIFLIALLL